MNDVQATDDVVQMLRDSARDFASRTQDFRGLRARAHRLPGFDEGHFAQMQGLGWRSVLIDEALGGAGMGLRAATAVAEELGKALLGEPFVATAVLPIRLLQDGSARPGTSALLGDAASGQRTFALAWQENAGSLNVASIGLQASRQSSGFVLSGKKRWVAGFDAATDVLVSARMDDGVAVFHLPVGARGLSARQNWQADGTPSTDLDFDRTVVVEDALLLDPPAGAAALTRALDAAAVVASGELLGIARTAFDMTLAYLRTRVQFDKFIGSFQALQHRAVDLLVQRELAAAVLEEAVIAFDDPRQTPAALAMVASRCKARCSDTALRITRECVQLHGAIGYTDEYDLGLYLKRALVVAAWLGNGTQHRRKHVDSAAAGDPPG